MWRIRSAAGCSGSNPRGIRAACSPLIAPKVRVKAGAASSRRSRRVPGADVAAHGVQRRRVGRVQTAADPDVAWPDLEVEAGATQPTERALRKERGDVGLQRPLVGAEPGIAPRPEQRDLGIGDEVGRRRGEVDGQPLDDGHHRPSHERLVIGAVLVKPLAAVVAGDGAQEAQRPWRESGRLGHRRMLSAGFGSPRRGHADRIRVSPVQRINPRAVLASRCRGKLPGHLRRPMATADRHRYPRTGLHQMTLPSRAAAVHRGRRPARAAHVDLLAHVAGSRR